MMADAACCLVAQPATVQVMVQVGAQVASHGMSAKRENKKRKQKKPAEFASQFLQ